MSSLRFEAFLARLYSDRAFLERFLSEPDSAMAAAHLDSRERRAAAEMDRVGLMMAARSYAFKRQRRRRGVGRTVIAMLSNLWRRLTWRVEEVVRRVVQKSLKSGVDR